MRALDRQLRTIALLTLLIAALGSIAVLTAEKDRSPLNTAIRSRPSSRVNSLRRSSAGCGCYAAITSSALSAGGGAGSARS